MFISLDLLPYFYGLSRNYGDLEDYLEPIRKVSRDSSSRSTHAAKRSGCYARSPARCFRTGS